MKLYEILTEGWANKFAKIQADIAEMTLPEAADYLKNKFDVDVVYKRGHSNNKMSVFGISTDGKIIKVGLSKDVMLKPPLTSRFSRNEFELPKVQEVNGLLQAFRHELQHVMQAKDGFDIGKDYRSARAGDDPVPSEKEYKFFQYVIQPAERSTAALDMATGLREQKKTVEDMVSAIETIAASVKAVMLDPKRVLMSGTLRQLKEPSASFDGNVAYYIGKVGAGLGVSQSMNDGATKSDQAQYHQFVKAVRSQYKRTGTARSQ